MIRDKKTSEFEDIEQLLRPKSDFRVSSDFKERLNKEIEVGKSHRGRWMMPWAAVAAAVVACVFIAAPFLLNKDHVSEQTLAASEVKKSNDSVKTYTLPSLQDKSLIAQSVETECKDKVTNFVKHNSEAAGKTIAPVRTGKREKSGIAEKSDPIEITDGIKIEDDQSEIDMMPELGEELVIMQVAYVDNVRPVSDTARDKAETINFDDIEAVSLNNDKMLLTEEEILKVRRMAQMEYVAKMRLEVEMTASLIRDIDRNRQTVEE